MFSYMTQHYRIISRGSSEGISPYFVLLGVTSANAQFGNILSLPASRADVACCKEVSPFECIAGLLGIVQIGTQWVCFATMSVHPLVRDTGYSSLSLSSSSSALPSRPSPPSSSANRRNVIVSSYFWFSSEATTPILPRNSSTAIPISLPGEQPSRLAEFAYYMASLSSLSLLLLPLAHPRIWVLGRTPWESWQRHSPLFNISPRSGPHTN